MITAHTVFLVGAGASLVWGYPTGHQLAEKVAGLTNGDETHGFLRGRLGFTDQTIGDFRYQFSRSGLGSIDAFLERRPEFMEIGKVTIARLLIRSESEKKLFHSGNSNWLRYLYQNSLSDADKALSPYVSFVTFNYDRSIEHFIFTALKNTYGLDNDTAATKAAVTKIVHLHGSLGPLPWQAVKDGRPFGPDDSEESVRRAAKSIKVVHEDIDEGRDADFAKAKSLLSAASHVYSLGFGFGLRNVERLAISSLREGVFLGTAVGLTGAEIDRVRRQSGGRINAIDKDIVDLLRNNVSWD